MKVQIDKKISRGRKELGGCEHQKCMLIIEHFLHKICKNEWYQVLDFSNLKKAISAKVTAQSLLDFG